MALLSTEMEQEHARLPFHILYNAFGITRSLILSLLSILEDLQGWVASNAVLLAKLSCGITVDLGKSNPLSL